MLAELFDVGPIPTEIGIDHVRPLVDVWRRYSSNGAPPVDSGGADRTFGRARRGQVEQRR